MLISEQPHLKLTNVFRWLYDSKIFGCIQERRFFRNATTGFKRKPGQRGFLHPGKATPPGVFDWVREHPVRGLGEPQQAHQDIQKNIPMLCLHTIRKAGKEHSLSVLRKEVNKICPAAKSTTQILRRVDGFIGCSLRPKRVQRGASGGRQGWNLHSALEVASGASHGQQRGRFSCSALLCFLSSNF